MIEEKNVRIHRGGRACDLLKLAGSDQGGGIGPIAALQDLPRNLGPRTFRERVQFSQRFVRIKLGNDGPGLYRAIFAGG